MNVEYEKARFADQLRTLGERQQQDAEAFLEALVEAATPQLLESGSAVIVVGNDEVASVARLLLAAHGHHTIEVQVAAKATGSKSEAWTAAMSAAKEAAGRKLFGRHRGPAHTPPTTKARKAARKRAKAGRKAAR